VVFSSPSKQIKDSILNYVTIPFCIPSSSLFINHPIIWHYVVWVTDSVTDDYKYEYTEMAIDNFLVESVLQSQLLKEIRVPDLKFPLYHLIGDIY
jgi:hypothetical protein